MKILSCGALVVGGGAAGMCAALAAQEHMQSQVMLIEYKEKLGGNSVYAPIPDVKEQNLSPEAAEERYLQMMNAHQWRSDARIVSTVSSRAPESIRWLHNRIDAKSGSLTERLAVCCEEAGVKFMMRTRAVQLLKDKKGWVCGVLVEHNGESIQINAVCVVLACGGFLGAVDLMEKYFPLYDAHTAEEVAFEGTPATGDGVRMALSAGAGDDCTASFEVSPNKVPFYHGTLSDTTAALVDNIVTPEGLWVNNVGVRFTNEAELMSFQAVYRQPNKEFHVIFDRGILEHTAERNPNIRLSELDQDIPKLIHADEAIMTDELGKLTAWIRGKTHIVYHTIERYNECCASGRDFLFGKPAEFMHPFIKPPFYGFRLGLALRSTHGPIRTNPMMAVVDKFDAPVPALISCGADVAGMYPGGFVDGENSIVWAITTGCLAGEHAAGFEHGMGPAAPCDYPKFTAEEVLHGDYYNVGTAPEDFRVMGGILELDSTGKKVLTHIANSPDQQGIRH